MDQAHYLEIFSKIADGLNAGGLRGPGLEARAAVWMNSVALKIQHPAWLNQTGTVRPFEESVFFSVWLNAETVQKNKVYYNIHALKMRGLKNYRIQSRAFAEAFRRKFSAFEKDWPQVSTKFGPLTLMEGWTNLDHASLENEVNRLAIRFVEIHGIIDELLTARRI